MISDSIRQDFQLQPLLVDSVPPGAITDLAVGHIGDTSATLMWTAPGDNGDSGRASLYDLRYSLSPVGTDTGSWWSAAETLSGEPLPSPPGMPDSCTIHNLLPDTTYYFVIRAADEVPNWSGFSNVAIGVRGGVGGLTGSGGLPEHFELFQNYPNPFNGTTVIRYSLPVARVRLSADGGRRTAVRLKIYNILGELVRTLVDEEQVPGYYSIVWDGKDGRGKEVSSGIFFYQLKTGRFVETQKMILLR